MNKKIKVTFTFVIYTLVITVFFGCDKSYNDISLEQEEISNTSTSQEQMSKACFVYDSLYKVSLDDTKNLLKAFRHDDYSKIDVITRGEDTVLYFVSHKKGWDVIAGDKRVYPMVARSENECDSCIEANDNLVSWMNSYADELYEFIQDGKQEFSSMYLLPGIENDSIYNKFENENTKLWNNISPRKKKVNPTTRGGAEHKWAVVSRTYCTRSTTNIVVPHLLETKWGQEFPWNCNFPIDKSDNQYCKAGCIAVSFAQMIYFAHYNMNKPNYLYHKISVKDSIDFATKDIGFTRNSYVSNSNRWDQMALKSTGDNRIVRYVSDFLLDVGNRFGLTYTSKNSGANFNDFDISALANYGLTCSVSDYNYETVRNNLFKGLPVVVMSCESNYNGHAWNIDGLVMQTDYYETEKHFEYTENWMHESEYYDTFDELRWKYNINSEYDYIYIPSSCVTREYLLMNWGYSGKSDDNLYSIYSSNTWKYYGNNAEYKDRKYFKTKIYYDFR